MRPDFSLRPSLLLLALAACNSGGDTTASAGTTEAPGTTDMSESAGSGTTDPGSTSDTPTTTDAVTTTEPGTTTSDDTTGTPPEEVIPLTAPCDLGPADATRLALLTNNFMDPASVHVLDLATSKLTADIAPAPADSALAWGDDKLIVIGRFGINTLDVLDGQTWEAQPTMNVHIDGAADPNPQALAFGPDGRAYLTALASAKLPVYDLDKPSADAQVDTLDLGEFADKDGSPEPGLAFSCGPVLFVGIQRLVDFVPVDLSYLVPLDTTTGQPIDIDAASDGNQAIALLGPWPKQARLDPADPSGHTVLVLTSGVERVDLSHGTSSWAVDPAVLADAGVEGFDPIGFTVAADGESVHLLASDGDYPAAAVFHVGLDARPPAAAQKLVPDLVVRDKVLERVGDSLWVGDATMGKPALRRFDLAQDPPSEGTSIATPGDPYLLLPLP